MSNLGKNTIACGADRRRRREKFRVLATKNQFFTIKNDKNLTQTRLGGGMPPVAPPLVAALNR